MRRNGRAEVHWYDFAADHEVEHGLERTKNGIKKEIQTYENVKGVEFLWSGKASSQTVAKRQYRVCVDFRIIF